MYRQRGLTLTGFIVWAIILAFVALLGMKLGPAYAEYYSIKKQFQAIAADPGVIAGGKREAEGAFVRRATMENIKSIGLGDLQIEKQGDRVVISADYEVRIPLVGNISALLTFHPSSEKR
jgi:hypothetical protein